MLFSVRPRYFDLELSASQYILYLSIEGIITNRMRLVKFTYDEVDKSLLASGYLSWEMLTTTYCEAKYVFFIVRSAERRAASSSYKTLPANSHCLS